MNCSKKVTLRNVTVFSVTLPKFAVLGAGLILADEPGGCRRRFLRRFDVACDIARAGKVLCITMGLCNFRGYIVRHGGTGCGVVSYDA